MYFTIQPPVGLDLGFVCRNLNHLAIGHKEVFWFITSMMGCEFKALCSLFSFFQVFRSNQRTPHFLHSIATKNLAFCRHLSPGDKRWCYGSLLGLRMGFTQSKLHGQKWIGSEFFHGKPGYCWWERVGRKAQISSHPIHSQSFLSKTEYKL